MNVQLRKKEPTDVTSSKMQFRKVESMKVTDFSFMLMNLETETSLKSPVTQDLPAGQTAPGFFCCDCRWTSPTDRWWKGRFCVSGSPGWSWRWNLRSVRCCGPSPSRRTRRPGGAWWHQGTRPTGRNTWSTVISGDGEAIGRLKSDTLTHSENGKSKSGRDGW